VLPPVGRGQRHVDHVPRRMIHFTPPLMLIVRGRPTLNLSVLRALHSKRPAPADMTQSEQACKGLLCNSVRHTNIPEVFFTKENVAQFIKIHVMCHLSGAEHE